MSIKRTTNRQGFTLIELMVAVAIIGLLIGLLVPALWKARAQAKLVQCATGMRNIGQALTIYAGQASDRLPLASGTEDSSWVFATAETGGRGILSVPDGTWVWHVQQVLGMDSPPWLAPLRCPTAVDDRASQSVGATDPNRPGSSWYLNAYCSGRALSSIPSPADGVMVHEAGIYDSMSIATGMLSFPHDEYMYPHPRVGFGTGKDWDDWLKRHRELPRRNILWCDGHVADFPAKTWPLGDQPFDEDRIRHMRFGLPGMNRLDP